MSARSAPASLSVRPSLTPRGTPRPAAGRGPPALPAWAPSRETPPGKAEGGYWPGGQTVRAPPAWGGNRSPCLLAWGSSEPWGEKGRGKWLVLGEEGRTCWWRIGVSVQGLSAGGCRLGNCKAEQTWHGRGLGRFARCPRWCRTSLSTVGIARGD